MMKRGYSTLEYIFKEILSEQYYKVEYDMMMVEDPFQVKKVPNGYNQ